MRIKPTRYLFILLFTMGLLAACGAPPVSPTATPTLSPSATPKPSTLVSSPSAPTATEVQATLIVVPTLTSSPSPTLVGFKIISPEDNAVVNTPEVVVQGEAQPETVITLNDVIVVVDQTGIFSATVLLEEGPNVIEIVTSDINGNEADFEHIVTYDPES